MKFVVCLMTYKTYQIYALNQSLERIMNLQWDTLYSETVWFLLVLKIGRMSSHFSILVEADRIKMSRKTILSKTDMTQDSKQR